MAGKAAQNTYQGALWGLTGSVLHGWAWRPDSPDERLVLEVYLDGITLGVTVANIFEPDLLDRGIGDGVHGFSFGLPGLAREQGVALQVRVANTDCWLPGHCNVAEQIERLDSQVFTDGGLRLTGWAQELAEQDRPVTIQVSTESGVFIEQVANKFNPLAAPRHKFCGFDISLPLELADGRAHRVNLATSTGQRIKGSPLTIACYPEGDAGFFAQALAPALEHSAVATVFAEMLHDNRHYTPRSLGFEQYPQWFELFGAPRHPLREQHWKFDLRWVGAGSKQRTLQSLKAQTHEHWAFDESGHYVALVGAGDTLPPWALAAVADALTDEVGILYTDCDQDDEQDGRTKPWFKPGWDPDLFCQQNYLAPLCVIAADIVDKFPQATPEELPYLAVAQCQRDGRHIAHLPLVCYHRRYRPRSWSSKQGQNHYQRSVGWNQPLRQQPLVSIIIPTRDHGDYLRRCIDSVRDSSYQHVELIVVDNQSTDDDARGYLAQLQEQGVRVLPYDRPFNFSAINNFAVEQCSGEIVCLLNNDVEVITPDWLEQMLALLLREDTGAVGAKLLWPNRMVQHGGVILGLNKVAGHYGGKCTDDDTGYFEHNQTVRRVAAVTAACMLVRKKDYLKVGGFNAVDFPVGFNDVDLCLKISTQLHKAIVWTPEAKLFHYESVSRGKEDRPEKQARAQREIAALRRHWGDVLLQDPAYNPNLNLDALAGAHEGLALPPRERRCR